MTLGLVSAAGSVGTIIVPLATQALLAHERWQIAVLLFLAMALVMLPAAFWAGGADKMPARSATTSSMAEVLGQAIRNRQFLVMSGAYFVCGLNLIFLTTHLPNYLAFCGQDPMLSAEALAVIGGTSAVGSLVTGWLGARYPKHVLLGYSAGCHIRCLFCAAAHADDHAAVRCRDGSALVARPGTTYWRYGCRDFRHPLFGDPARCILRCASGWLVVGSLGWRLDLRSFRLL